MNEARESEPREDVESTQAPALNDHTLASRRRWYDGLTLGQQRVEAWWQRTPVVRRLSLAALGVFLFWRVGLLFLDYVGLSLFPTNSEICRPQWEVFEGEHYLLNGYFRWDAAWYASIVKKGYRFSAEHSSNAAFYPLLPGLTRAVALLVGDWRVAALIVVNICSLGLVAALERLSAFELPKVDTRTASHLLLAFPSSFFLVSFFSESVFLVCAAFSMFGYVRQRYVSAGVWGMLAMLSRSTGLVLAIALLADLIWRRVRDKQPIPWRASWLALVPAGLGVFAILLWNRTGEPLAFLKAQEFWRPDSALPWVPLFNSLGGFEWDLPRSARNVQRLLDSGAALFVLGTALAMAVARFRPCYWLYTLGVVVLPLCTGTMMGMSRMCLAAFPAFLFWASVLDTRESWKAHYLFVSGGLLILNSLRFMGCGWVG